MSYLNALLSDLRDRKLWPVPLVLLAALVAVPVLLSKSPAPQHPAPIAGLSVSNGQTGTAVTVNDTPVQAPLGAGGRDPFTQQKLPGATSSSGTGATVAAASGGSAASSASAGSSSTVSSRTGSVSSTGSTGSTGGNGVYRGGGGATTGNGGGTTGTTTTTPSHRSAPLGLTQDQSYGVEVGLPLSSGGFQSVAAERGYELPSASEPQLIELGVAQSGNAVLFAVMPNTVVSGGGTCIPGPLDCEILSLAPNQTENIGVPQSTTTHWLGSFTLTSITAQTWSSTAKAAAQRAAANRAGERLVTQSPERALSLFSYNPSLGIVVDERNLQVGGN